MRHLLQWVFMFGAMALTQSEAAIAGILRLRLAIGRSGVPRKVVAQTIGVSEARLSEMLSGLTPFSYARICELFAQHPEIEDEELALRAKARGARYLPHDELCELVDAVQAMTASQHAPKEQPAKMALESDERREVA